MSGKRWKTEEKLHQLPKKTMCLKKRDRFKTMKETKDNIKRK